MTFKAPNNEHSKNVTRTAPISKLQEHNIRLNLSHFYDYYLQNYKL